MPSGDREIFNLLERLRDGTQELPPGCEVTYELEAVEILKALLQGHDQTRACARPVLPGLQGAARRPADSGRGLPGRLQPACRSRTCGLVGPVRRDRRAISTTSQRRALEAHGAFIDALDTTEMVKSYKMLVLLAMLNAERFPGVDRR